MVWQVVIAPWRSSQRSSLEKGTSHLSLSLYTHIYMYIYIYIHIYTYESADFHQNSVCCCCCCATALSTVSNWQYWIDFLSYRCVDFPSLFLVSSSWGFYSPSFWDSPPFAVHLANASKGVVLNASLDLSSPVSAVRNVFTNPDTPLKVVKQIQKSLSAAIKPFIFPANALLSFHIKLRNRRFFSPLLIFLSLSIQILS